MNLSRVKEIGRTDLTPVSYTHLNLPTDEIEATDETTEPDREPTAEETESPDPPPPPMDEYERTVADADKGNKWSQYLSLIHI